jgi:hypothetical protein
MTGSIEWSTLRKGRVLYDALRYREAGGSIRKLTRIRKEEGVDWPSNGSVRGWLIQYDTLKKHNPHKSEIELLDEASRCRGRTNRFGRPVKLSGDILNEMVDGPSLEHRKPLKHWMEKAKVSRSCIKRAQKSIAKMATVENCPTRAQDSASVEPSQS